MKKPNLQDLASVEQTDDFSEAVQVQHEKTAQMVRKTFTIQQGELDYINSVALGMSKEAGKVISASEALRAIINRAKGAKS
jgi:hypothetical protein